MQKNKEAKKKNNKILCLSVSLLLCFSPLKAQELIEQKPITIETVNQFSYNLQKYTGFNFVMDFLAEAIIKVIVKLKTKAENVSVDLKTYSGWDLIRKKAKLLHIKSNNLFIKNIPIEYFELVTKTPIYFKKNKKRKNQVVFPLQVALWVRINLDNVTEVLNSLPKWQQILAALDLPIPPFGTTKIKLGDMKININKKGVIQVSANVSSLVNSEAESLKLMFSGNLTVREKKIIIDDLQSQVEDIFTKDSDIGQSFSKFLEELINPIFNLNKYEKNGLTIDHVELTFEANSLVLEISLRLLPEEV